MKSTTESTTAMDELAQTLRDLDEIMDAEEELSDKAWYDAHMAAVVEAADKGICPDCAGLGEGEEHARHLEDTYGLEALEPCCDFCTGMLYGKLDALRWVLGEEERLER